MNIGKGIQKWKVEVIKHKLKALKPENRKDFSVWLGGAIMTACAGPLFTFAFKFSDQPSVITSLGGVGLIGVLIFSKIVLKEHICRKKIGGAVLIIIGTILINVFSKQLAEAQSFDPNIFISISIGYCVLFILFFLIGFKWRNITGKLLSIAAGTSLGMAMLLADVALVSSDGDVFRQFLFGYVYAAIMAGNVAFVTTQFALMREEGSIVIPIIHSIIILTSVVMEYVIFSSALAPVQLLGIAVIIFGVFFLTSKDKKLEHSVFE